jgi:hypothetical protein
MALMALPGALDIPPLEVCPLPDEASWKRKTHSAPTPPASSNAANLRGDLPHGQPIDHGRGEPLKVERGAGA